MSRSSRRRKRLKARKQDNALRKELDSVEWSFWMGRIDEDGHTVFPTDPEEYRDDWGDHEPPPRIPRLVPVVLLALAGWALAYWALA